MKIVVCSDTHTKHRELNIPNGDIFIFAGDFEIRSISELLEMRDWLNELPHKDVVVIYGNHDFTETLSAEKSRQVFGNKITYLQNSFSEVQGFKIWGSPYSPYFNNWAWMQPDNMLKDIWDNIPLETDIIIAHTMPYGILDRCGLKMESVGSLTLRDRIKEVQPKIFIGGHLHESFGQYTDGKTDYYNVAVLDEMYQIANPITIMEV